MPLYPRSVRTLLPGLALSVLTVGPALAWTPCAAGEFGALLAIADEPAADLMAELRGLAAALGPRRAPHSEEEQDTWQRLSVLPRPLLRELVTTLLGEGASDPERRVSLQLLTTPADAASLSLAYDLARPPEGRTFVTRPVHDALEALLLALHESDAGGTRAIAARFPALDRTLQEVTLRAVVRGPLDRSIGFMEDFVGLDRYLDVALLVPLARLWARSPTPPSPPSRQLVRRGLDSGDPWTRREAALAVGWMDLDEAVPDLVSALEDRQESVRDAALWSLRRLSGMRLRADAAQWQRWLEQEQRWWEQRASQIFTLLLGEELTPAVHAINEVAGRRLRRRELAAALEPVLLRHEPVLVELACTALGQIGAPSAISALTGVLEHSDEGVRASAQRALEALQARTVHAGASK